MAAENREANDREMLVNLAIYDYHAAIDRGESLEPADWVAHHPAIASELKVYFDDLARLHLLRPAAPVDQSETTDYSGQPGPGAPGRGLPAADFRPDDVLGDYVLLEKLGEGGQGVVWKARSRQEAEIVVALKTLRGPTSTSTASVDRLRQDARAIARMKHPNIIGTSYFGEDGGRWFFVMDLVEGGTVEDRLESYQADPRSAAVLIEKIARAIHHAHTRSRGVLHLDLKPGNILLTADGEPKVTDFGLSVRSGAIDPSEEGPASERSGSREGASDLSVSFARAGIVGTLPFMSPEMAGGRWSEVSTASDVYGLGAILYTMLTGRAPFRGRDARETLSLVIQGTLTSPRELNRQVDRELNAVCLKCLDRNPANRYGSADALANDLRRWLDLRPTLAGGKPSAAREIHFWVRRHPLRFARTGGGRGTAAALALAGLAVSVAELRVENRRAAGRLAGQVDRELRLIRRATQILASDSRLRSAFASFAAPDQSGQRQRAIEAFLKASIESENLFGIAGGNPFVNVLVMGPDGVLLADTLADSPAVGKDYHVRDYYRAFFENQWPRDYVYIARSFLSIKDGRYKIAVSTRIGGDHGKLLGVLVANFTIGPRLIDVDMRQDSHDATVLCPMDRSDPQRGIEDPGPRWSYIFVLDRRYTVEWNARPFEVAPSRLPDFQGNPALVQASGGLEGGQFVDYHRVGESHLVVVMRDATVPGRSRGSQIFDDHPRPEIGPRSADTPGGARVAPIIASPGGLSCPGSCSTLPRRQSLPGPLFLALFWAVAVVVIAAAALGVRRLDPSLDLDPLPRGFKLTAQELACLRGGAQALLHTTLFDLWRRGFLEIVEPKKRQQQMVQAENGPEPAMLDTYEREILDEFVTPRSLTKLPSHAKLVSLSKDRARALESILHDELLLMPDGARAAARSTWPG